MTLMNEFIRYLEYNMKLVVIKNNFLNLLVSNYCVFQITIIYIKINATMIFNIPLIIIITLFIKYYIYISGLTNIRYLFSYPKYEVGGNI